MLVRASHMLRCIRLGTCMERDGRCRYYYKGLVVVTQRKEVSNEETVIEAFWMFQVQDVELKQLSARVQSMHLRSLARKPKHCTCRLLMRRQ